MNISSWGNNKQIDAEVFEPRTYSGLKGIILSEKSFIPRGEGKSYGDSALSRTVIKSGGLNHMLDFDAEKGILRCQSGVTLETILHTFVPRGWFIYSTPGTKLISVGGAVASDVHGKSHHMEGTFGKHVRKITLMLPDGTIVECTPDKNTDLFRATCGGMGLTGFILEVTLQLKAISSSFLGVKTHSSKGLREVMELFRKYRQWDYSVAWLDCFSDDLERMSSIFTAGQFMESGNLKTHDPQKITVPFTLPTFTLNRFTGKAFNLLYYWINKIGSSSKKVHYDSFFYPLDSIGKWNRIYGTNGFTQYQFVVPHEHDHEVMSKVLNRIRRSNYDCYLAVLKAFGKKNDHYLSFPQKGFSLALDFKIEEGLFEFLRGLDEIVVEKGGRIYLTKDAHISEHIFKKGYPEADKFLNVLEKYGIMGKITSLQSKRIGLG